MLETNSPRETGSREIVVSRVFDAPRDLVFDAWTHPSFLEKWWGPRGFTTTTHAFDFRQGGGWTHTMHGPDGKDYPNRLVYDEIVRPERIVDTHHGGVDGVRADFHRTVTFVARGDQTEVTIRMLFASAAERDAVVEKYGAVEGGKQTLMRLGEHLAERPELRMSRVFDAPRRLVFEAWSKAEHVSRWFTPQPLTTPSCEVDLQKGGVFRLVMRMPDGTELPMEGVFRDVVPDERIVFTAKIHGDNLVWTDVRFVEQDGKTTMTVHQVYAFVSDATAGARMGWTATLDQLAAHVAMRSL
jgi:uncharacterized protein YndB with AHSA1/START domain